MFSKKGPGIKEISAAREILGLPKVTTLAAIKRAYREKCRRWHPDVNGPQSEGDPNQMMQSINEAYRILLAYCRNYEYCLEPQEEKADEDWWMERFGADSHWGKTTPSE